MTSQSRLESNYKIWLGYSNDWNAFARDVFNVKLDEAQQECLYKIQVNSRVNIRSGHARGKDFIGAAACLCFLYLNIPSKVICTAPTDRQVVNINMAEIATISSKARIPLPGIILNNQIKIFDSNRKEQKDWFLLAFKARDKSAEAWTGFHSSNIMIMVTEASGVEDASFDAIEGILTGNSKEVLIYNPTRLDGMAFRTSKAPKWESVKLSCLDAPNVIAKKTIIPGQVDYDWVEDKVERWCTQVDKLEKDQFDFKWEGKIYRPDDRFKVKVLGEFPSESINQVIPAIWIELANERWREAQKVEKNLRLGCDVAGMGRDQTVFAHRYGDYIEKFETFPHTDHMEVAGLIAQRIPKLNDMALIDTIGEGAGVYSRLAEMNEQDAQEFKVFSAKFSENAKGYTDKSEMRVFANMRSFCYWAIRDALDPKYGGDLALPPDEELAQELTEVHVKTTRSDRSIVLEPKEDIQKRIGRSPDKADALALSFYPADYEAPLAWIGEPR